MAFRSARPLVAAGVAVLALPALLVGCTGGTDDSTPPTAGAGSCAVPSEIGTAAPSAPASSDADASTAPEQSSGYRSGIRAAAVQDYVAVTANPVASATACQVLQDGGTAADALVAAQMVLGLVEPQSSGIGGGAFALYYDAASGAVTAYDGRETAPAAATENDLRWIADTAQQEPLPSARASGRAIGVPGTLRLLEAVHGAYGKKPWAEGFSPAIGLAEDGFRISPRLAGAIDAERQSVLLDAEMSRYLLTEDGEPQPAGTLLKNPAYAATLSAIAKEGADAFYTGDIAQSIVDSVTAPSGERTPGKMTLDDLASYRAVERDPLCERYRDRGLCSMPPPSSGGIAVAQTLGILASFDLSDLGPADKTTDGGIPRSQAIHLVSEAERLTYADRNAYVADPDFVPLPGGSSDALLAPSYLSSRAALIDREHSMGTARPGDFPGIGGNADTPEHGTSHITVADRFGNVAAMTTTIESAFGSYHMTDTGIILNNELTDFSATPTDEAGTPVANRLEGGKRPRSSMSPTLLFDLTADGARDRVIGAVGSPGGSVIIQYVVKAIVGMTDWGMDPQQAISMVNFGAGNTPTTGVGGEHPLVAGPAGQAVIAELIARGHTVSTTAQTSGASAIIRSGDSGWLGGADPRREGVVLGGSPSR